MKKRANFTFEFKQTKIGYRYYLEIRTLISILPLRISMIHRYKFSIFYPSKNLCKMLGCKPEDLLKKTIFWGVLTCMIHLYDIFLSC